MNRIKKRAAVAAGIGIIILLAAFIEVLCFNMTSTRLQGDSSVFYALDKTDERVSTVTEETLVPLTEAEQNSILMNRENARILAEFNKTKYVQEEDESLVEDGNKMYRKKVATTFTVYLPTTSYLQKIYLEHPDISQNCSYELQVWQDTQVVYQGIDGIADTRINPSVILVGKNGDKIEYRIFSEEELNVSKMQLAVVNQFQFNWLRFFFFAASGLLILLFIVEKDRFAKRPETLFAGIGLLLGTLLILTLGTNQIGYDEYVHAARAYDISFGSTIETTETAMRMKANDLPIFHNVEERRLVEAYENENHDFSWAEITTQSKFITYTDRSYLPIGIFMRMGRMLQLPFAWCIMLGKMGNLLVYLALGYLAIRFAKTGKGMVAVLALLPNQLFAATAITYDAMVNGFLLLAVVLTTNLILEKDKKIIWWQALFVLGAYIAGSTAKPIYMVMALMLLFLPSKKFENKPQEYLFKLCVIGITGLLTYTIFFPPVSANSSYELMGNLAYAGDKRNQGTSVLGQLQYILSNPLRYSKLLLQSMFGDLWRYLSGGHKFFNYGYLGSLPGIWNVIGVLLIGGAALSCPEDENRPVLPKAYKIQNIAMIFAVSAIIWTSMYVSFTPVGNQTIEGVQARYFMPLFLPVLYCLFQNKRKCRISPAIYYKILFGFAVLLNLLAIYTLALKPMNF